MRFGPVFTVVVAVVALSVSTVHADEATARQRFEHGMKAYNLQEWTVALSEFKAAYVEKPDAVLLFNIGQAQRQLGQYDAAAKSYRAFLNQGRADAAQRESVETLVHQMDDAAKEERAKRPPSGTIAPDRAFVAMAPAPPAKWYRSAAGWSFAGGGLVVGFAGMGLFLHGADVDGQIGSASSLAQAQELAHTRDNYRVAGEVLIGVGGAALLSGAIVLAVRAGHQTRGAR